MLIGNVRINSGVILHFVLSFFLSYVIFSYLILLAVNTKVNTDYYREFMLRINFLFILRISVNFSVILSSKRKMNSTINNHVIVNRCYIFQDTGFTNISHCSIAEMTFEVIEGHWKSHYFSKTHKTSIILVIHCSSIMHHYQTQKLLQSPGF